jgi:ADP-ribose pyrophosphatase YjhB (NUDIX family)
LRGAEEGEQQAFIVIRRNEPERILGSTRFMDIQPGHRTVEVGWTWLSPAVRGTAVNVEMKRLMLGRAFDEWGARRVTLKTDRRNAASRRSIEKLGASCEGVLRQHRLNWDGASRDTVYYGILDQEWPAVRAWLDHRLAVAREEARKVDPGRKPTGEIVMPPRVGTAVLIRCGGALLLLRRRGVRGVGAWGAPGGWIDPGEAPREAAVRELREETGLQPQSMRFLAVTNDLIPGPPTHAVTIWLEGGASQGEIRMNADESSEWRWCSLDELPDELFLPLRNLVAGRSLPPDAWSNWARRMDPGFRD